MSDEHEPRDSSRESSREDNRSAEALTTHDGKPSTKGYADSTSLPVPTGFQSNRALSPDTVRHGGIRSPSRSRSPYHHASISAYQKSSSLRGSLAARARNRASIFWESNKGPVFVLIAQFFNVLMNVSARILQKEGNHGKGLHPFQVLFARMGITCILASIYMWYKKTEHFPLGMKEVRWLLCIRSFGGFFGVFGVYYSLQYLPLSDATVITFLAPSLACYACSLFIHEPFTRMEQIGAYISIIGVVLIARPTSLFPTSTSTPSPPDANGLTDTLPPNSSNTTTTIPLVDPYSYTAITPSQRASAVAVALLGVLGAACAYTTVRWIGKRAHPLISVNYYAAWTTFVCLFAMTFVPSVGFVLPQSAREWTLLGFLGVCGFVMQFLLAAGLQAEKSSRATNMVYTQMLFALGFDQVVFGTTPSGLSIVGSSLILGSAVYVAVNKEKMKKKSEVVGMRADEERGLVEVEVEEEEGMNGEEGERGRSVELRAVRM